MEVKATGVTGWTSATLPFPCLLPFTPLGIDEVVFEYYMRYIYRKMRFTFGDTIASASVWLSWAMSEINAQAQGRSWYKWMSEDALTAWDYFNVAAVRVMRNPTFEREVLKTVEPSTILATYKERVWLYRQEWYGRKGYNKFEEIGPLGDIGMWNSRDPKWVKGWPDRMCFALKYYDLIEDVPQITARFWTHAAVIYLGRGYKLREGEYYLTRADEWRANLRSPSTAWMGW